MSRAPPFPEPNNMVNSPGAAGCGMSIGWDEILGVSAGRSPSNGPRKKSVKSPAFPSSSLGGMPTLSEGAVGSGLKSEPEQSGKTTGVQPVAQSSRQPATAPFLPQRLSTLHFCCFRTRDAGR